MTLSEAMEQRHSVRAYTDKPIEKEKIDALNALIAECNRDGDLHIQLVQNEPKAFDCMLAHYGKFSGVKNYIALIGKDSDDFDEKSGYFGEKLVLFAQTLGLNTCWVAMSYKKIKNAFVVGKGEKLGVVIALGYGKTQGVAHKSKAAEQVANVHGAPDWFVRGVNAALLAPTAINQQKFKFTFTDRDKVKAEAGVGFYTKLDLGIAKLHFELGAGKENFTWVK
ncbi:MAG: nitroreductase [Clostridia bacterium]|nr:nitroreductase [Clostridia bacterium]